MPRSTRHRPSAALGALACAGLLFAQGMIVGGNALDRNLMVGSGGMNARTARNVMPMQNSIYSVQDGRMQYNEAAAFAQPRYIPVGREGAVQTAGMIYGSRTVTNPALATSTSMARPRGVYDEALPSRAPQFERSALSNSRYSPSATGVPPRPVTHSVPSPSGGDPLPATASYRPASGYATDAQLRASISSRAAPQRASAGLVGEGVASDKYRVTGVGYGFR